MYATMTKDNKSLFLYTLITIFGGLMTGTNIAGISGAVPLLQEYWGTGDLLPGALVAILMAGAGLGHIAGRVYAHRMNRKCLMLLSVILLIVAPLGNALAEGVCTMLVFRFTAGVGLGILGTVIPACLAALFSSRVRTALLSYHHLSVAIGILIAYIADYLLLGHAHNWRLMMGFPIVSAFVCFLLIGITPMPRSASSGACGGEPENGQRYGRIPFLISLQQLSGISVIICYTPVIFEKTGMESDRALTYTVFTGIINLLFTALAIWQTRVLSNRRLWVCGSLGMSLSLLYSGCTFAIPAVNPAGFTIALFCYLGCYMLSAMPFLPGNKYLPASLASPRTTGISPMTANCLFSFVTLLLFPWQLGSWGGSVTFGIFAVFSVIAYLYILFRPTDTTTDTIHYTEKKLTVKQSS